MPAGPGPHPVIIMLHGSGRSDRTDGGGYAPLIDRFRKAGLAVLSWDKPGVGESTGPLSYDSDVLAERSGILLAAVEFLKAQPNIDPAKIGIWGVSQGTYVMALSLELTDAIEFLIMVGGPAMDAYDQSAFLLGQLAACAGATLEEAKSIEAASSAAEKATTYQEYLDNIIALQEDPWLIEEGLLGDLVPEEVWEPEDRTRLGFFNPVDVLKDTTIPVLAVFGEKDRQVDPIQGAAAYQQALEAAGNESFRVEVIAGADHTIVRAETGCLSERAARSPADRVDYATAYLDLMQDWLTQVLATGS
jgi:pimeloyl-ACP methyl ester carboxylesterase